MRLYIIAAVLAIAITIENAIATSWILFPLYWGLDILPGVWGPLVSVVSVLLVVGLLTMLLKWFMVGILVFLTIYCFPAIHFGKIDYALGDLARDHLAHNPRDVQEVSHIFFTLHMGLIGLAVAAVVVVLALVLRRV